MPVLKNPKHEAFVANLLKGMTQGPAYTAAGYTAEGHAAEACGNKLLKNAEIAARLAELQAAVTEKAVEETALDKRYVLNTIHDTIERCRQARPVIDRKGEPVMIEAPNGDIVPAYVFDAKSVLRGAELIGKDLGMFKDRVELTGKDGAAIETKETGNGRDIARRIAFALQRAAARPSAAG